MADIAGLEPASCGFESRSPHHYQSSDSSTDRTLGYEPDDVGSIPPLTTISQELHVTASQPFTMPAVPRDAVAPILNTPYSILSSLSGP